MSFHAKSAAIVLLVITAVYGIYFARVLPHGVVPPADYVPELMVVAATLIALMIIAHTVIAIVSSRPNGALDDRPDERDRLIEQRADARSGYVLAAGAFGVLTLVITEAPHFWIAHAVLASLVVSEMAKQALRLVDYARGV